MKIKQYSYLNYYKASKLRCYAKPARTKVHIHRLHAFYRQTDIFIYFYFIYQCFFSNSDYVASN
jgi:hypothetical protein